MQATGAANPNYGSNSGSGSYTKILAIFGFLFLSQKVFLDTLKMTFFVLSTVLRGLMRVFAICYPNHLAQHNLNSKIKCRGARAGAVI
jgi:hypothetical protein